MTKIFDLFATTPKGLELLLVEELRELGAIDPAEKLAGVTFKGDLSVAYKACLWSRFANRILLTLTKVPALTAEQLYAGVQTIEWDKHIRQDATFAVHFVTTQSEITHTLFGAQKVKDAIVDQLRDKYGERPDVQRDQPDVSVYLYLYRDEAVISIDLSGESLHKRGYRISPGSAPLKENLAAAILQRAGWPAIAKEGGTLMDPMCGSGTLLVEAAFMAANIAPGLNRDYFGFLGWKQHDERVWENLVTEAGTSREQGLASLPEIIGYDHDPEAIKIAFENIERADMLGKIHVEKRDLVMFAPKPNAIPGLVVTNPPYGERLGEVSELQPLYTELGEKLKQGFTGWKAAVFTGNPDLGKQMGLRSKKYYALFNGTLPCKLLLFSVEPEYFVDRSPGAENKRRIRAAQKAMQGQDQRPVQMFINRLRKNLKQIKLKSNESQRVYDADIPEYAFTIDISEEVVQVNEYEAPRIVSKDKVLRRRNEVLAILPEILEVDGEKIYFNIVPKDDNL